MPSWKAWASRFCKAPVEIRENGLICRDTVKGEDGKFTQVEGSEIFYPPHRRYRVGEPGLREQPCQDHHRHRDQPEGLLTVEDGSTTPRGRVCRRRRRDGCPHRGRRLWLWPRRWLSPWTPT